MHRLNTSEGVRDVREVHPDHTLNTTSNTYLDEDPEVIGTSAGDSWHAVLGEEQGLRAVPLACWAQRDDVVFYGVCAPRNSGSVDLTTSIGDHPDFRGYIRPPANADVSLMTGADIKELLTQQTIEEEV